MSKSEATGDNLSDLALALRSNDSGLRCYALKQAIDTYRSDRRKSSKAVLLLIARCLLFDAESTNRSDALNALNAYGNMRDYRAAMAATNDEAWEVRCSAFYLLAKLGKRRTKKRLLEGMSDRHPVVRRYAAVGLADAIGPDSVPLLEEALKAELDVLARVGILYGLAIFGSKEARAEVIEHSQNSNAWISSPAKETLRILGVSNKK